MSYEWFRISLWSEMIGFYVYHRIKKKNIKYLLSNEILLWPIRLELLTQFAAEKKKLKF